jgi:hypothetical protein
MTGVVYRVLIFKGLKVICITCDVAVLLHSYICHDDSISDVYHLTLEKNGYWSVHHSRMYLLLINNCNFYG